MTSFCSNVPPVPAGKPSRMLGRHCKLSGFHGYAARKARNYRRDWSRDFGRGAANDDVSTRIAAGPRTCTPCVLSIVAAALILVQVRSGFDNVNAVVKRTHVGPAHPWNVKVPPDDGIAPAASVAVNAPFRPNCDPSVTASPAGPVSVIVPASRPSQGWHGCTYDRTYDACAR